MPSYPGAAGSFVPVKSNASPLSLAAGDQQYVLGQLAAGATQLPVNDTNVTFEAAPVAATQASVAVTGGTMPDSDAVASFSVEAHCNGVPGAAESLAVQVADTDADAFYVTPSDTSYTLATFNANNVAHSVLNPAFLGEFIRVVRTKGANAVGITVKISRMT